MKTFNRSFLPDSIEYNGKTYWRDLDKTILKRGALSFDVKKCIAINVLEKNLRGKTDLHGMPYKAHTFIFSTETP